MRFLLIFILFDCHAQYVMPQICFVNKYDELVTFGCICYSVSKRSHYYLRALVFVANTCMGNCSLKF